MRPIFTWKHNPPLFWALKASPGRQGRGRFLLPQPPVGFREVTSRSSSAGRAGHPPWYPKTAGTSLGDCCRSYTSNQQLWWLHWFFLAWFCCPVEGIAWFHSGVVWFKNVHLCRLELHRQAGFVRERVKTEQSFRKKVYFEVFLTIWSAFTFKSSIIFWDKLTSQIRKLNTIIKA